MKPRVGNRVFLTKQGRMTSGGTTTQLGHVTKVGRSYFYARGDGFRRHSDDLKFALGCSNGSPDKNCDQSMYAWRVWESEAAYLEFLRRGKLLNSLFARGGFERRYKFNAVPTENIEKALELLGIGVDAS